MFATALASALGVGVACSTASIETQTRVRMLDPAPLTLRGVGFARDERVRFTVSLGDETAVRKLRANDAGAFTALFRELRYERCVPCALGDGNRVTRPSRLVEARAARVPGSPRRIAADVKGAASAAPFVTPVSLDLLGDGDRLLVGRHTLHDARSEAGQDVMDTGVPAERV